MYIGFDIGGTKTEVIVLDDAGKTHFKKRIATAHQYHSFIENILALVIEAEQTVGQSCTIGIGLPGVLDPKTSCVKNSNCTFLNGKNLKKDLGVRLNKEVYIANDANCFALSEAVDGAGATKTVVFGVILGTGCGGGIVVNQHILEGLNANTGEWGHNPLPNYSLINDGENPICFCGGEHCLEQFISGTGFTRQYNQIAKQKLTGPEIFILLEQENELAERIYYRFLDQLARSLAVVINLLDPDVIVFGGGLSNVLRIYDDVRKIIPKYTITPDIEINLSPAKYGDSSGIRGAAWLGK
jgi:fructokinase